MADKKDYSKKSPLRRWKGHSVEHVREHLRKRFQERQKSIRQANQYTNRNINPVIENLRKAVITSADGNLGSSLDEVVDYMLKTEQDIKEETLQEEAEIYQSLEDQIIGALLENTNSVCVVCNSSIEFISDTNVICKECADKHFSVESL